MTIITKAERRALQSLSRASKALAHSTTERAARRHERRANAARAQLRDDVRDADLAFAS